mmetsp:Transcript_16332/g.27999  ORF Transcript_16332/g.27999 Transcript_16332/m.27999 type:complete len:403 (+) Transcript_16332:38-1246(+)
MSVLRGSHAIRQTGSCRGPPVAAASRRAILLHAPTLSLVAGLVLPGMTPALAAAEEVPVGMPHATLAPGLDISRVIKGCWQLSGGHRGDKATDRTAGQAALEDFSAFYAAGITTWDCADHYGPAEALIGKWIAQTSQATGKDVRSMVQVCTKVCVFDSASMAGVSQASTRSAVDRSVKQLGGPPDLVAFYWGDYNIARYVDGAKFLAEEQSKGRFGHLGMTNFDVKRMAEITDAGVKVVSNQVQYSLLDRRPELGGMTEFCSAQDIKLLPYGVLAGGLLSKKYLGASSSSVTLDTYSKQKYSRVLSEAGGWEWFQRLLRTLQGIAEKHNTSLSNVAARWVLDKPCVAGVVLGARNATHVPDHLALGALMLDAQDQDAIAEVLAAGQKPTSDCYNWERGLNRW